MNQAMVPIGAVLTGGASRRFGSDKALAPLGPGSYSAEKGTTGKARESFPTMGAKIVAELRAAGADPVVAVGGSAGHALGVPVVPDQEPGLGPLAGLASVLVWAGRGTVLVVPCDLPLLESQHLSLLIEAARADLELDQYRTNPRAIIAMVDGVPQPTIACWPAGVGLGLLRAVRSGDRAMGRSLDLVPWLGVELDPTAAMDADDPATLTSLVGDPDADQ